MTANAKENVACPLKDVPECWNDALRMGSLYAPFRLKSVNPVDWESKMSFWCDAIGRWCLQSENPIFSIDELKSVFKRNNKSPACLDTVVDHMIKMKNVCSTDQFQSGLNDGWVLWGTKQLLRPVSWASKTLMSKFVSSEPENKGSLTFVHVEALKKQALSLIANTPENCRIGSITKLVESERVPLEVFNLLLKWLLSEKLITVSSDGKIYKLSENINTKVSPLNETEICLHNIKLTIDKLQIVIEDLEFKIETAKDNAKSQIIKKNKSLAMNQLKHKKTFEIRLEKVLNNYDSLVHMSDVIKQTHVDSQVFEIFKNSLAALKKTTKEKGLEETTVINTMDDVKQVLDDIAEMQSLLAQPIGTQYDEDELEAELNNLNLDADVGNDNGGMTKPDSNIELSQDLSDAVKDNKNLKGKAEKDVEGQKPEFLLADT